MNTSQIIELSILSFVGLFTIFIFPINLLYVYTVTKAYSIDKNNIIKSIPTVLNDILKGSKKMYKNFKIYLETNSRNDNSGYEADNESDDNNKLFADSDSAEESGNEKTKIEYEKTILSNNLNAADEPDDNCSDEILTKTSIENIENTIEIDSNVNDNKVYSLRNRSSQSDSELNLKVDTSL